MTPARARTRRRLAGLALSLGVHAAILLAFMSVTPRLITLPRLPPPSQTALQLDLARRPAAAASSRASAAAHRSAASASAAPASAPGRRPRPPSDLPAPSAAARAAPGATVAPAGGGAIAPSAGPAGDARWRVREDGGDVGAAARALVRGTVGCGDAEWLHLTRDERDRCNAEFVRGMRTLRPDAIPPAKRAYYDQVVAAYAEMHAPMPMSEAALGDNLGVQERWHAPPGAHGPGLGCGLALGRPRGWKTYANRAQPPHSLQLRLGPIACMATPPSGFGTEEADVAPPASLREQQDDEAHAARYAPPPR